MKPVIESEKLAAALEILKAAEKPIQSAELAARLKIYGKHETQRRRVREIIAELRDRGHWIVANSVVGLWLTKDAAIWKTYNEHQMIDAKHIIGEAARRKKQAAEPPGQGHLFTLRPTAFW